MYRFILGGSGSGKTNMIFTDCIKAAMANKNSQFFLIAPEQSTTWMEKQIVKRHPNHATDNIDVLSFSRLAHRVFDELNIVNLQVLDDISKAMILRKIGEENKDNLRVWGSRFDKPGFVDNLKSMLSELYQYGISPEDLTRHDELDNRLNDKIDDLKLIYEEFRKTIKDKFVTAEEIPDILAKNIHKSNLIKDSVIFLDGFTGFTPIQYRIIEEFLCYAKEVVVAVSIGSDRDNALFDMSNTMINKISCLGDKNSINHGEDTILTTDNFLENHFLRYDGIKSNEENVRIVRAHDAIEEAEFVATDIERLVKLNGHNYFDIAVVCGDINAYSKKIKHEFELANIPYYVDETIGITENTLVLMVESALDIIRTNYSYESIARYLKTSLVSDDDRLIDAMDIYMYECGRRGYSRLKANWDYMPNDLAEDINREEIISFKDEVLNNLENLHNVYIDKKAKVSETVDAIKELMTNLGVEDKLSKMAEEFDSIGDAKRAREYAKVFTEVNELLSKISSLLGDEQITCDEFLKIFVAGVEQIKLGMLPSGLDRVLVGDITRSRLEDIKVLYVLGANEGSIPKLLNRGSVITDSEKEKLKGIGYELAPTAKEDLFIQRYYLYRVLTKPTEELVLTFATADNSGAPLQPSYIVSYLKNTYTKLEIKEAVSEKLVLDINAAIRRVSDKLRSIRIDGVDDKDTEFNNLYAYLVGDSKSSSRVELITTAALYAYSKAKLSKESTNLLYGDTLSGSVSKLELFAKCPYEYFAKYGLKLKEIEPFAFRAVDIGNLAHATLEKIFEMSTKGHISIESLSGSEREKLVNECIKASMLDDDSAKYKDTAKNEYITKRVERVVNRSLWGLLENLKDEFTPYKVEWMFNGGPGISASNLLLDDGKVLKLSGRVDRTDIREGDGLEVGARVIDYKSGSKTWDINDVINGNDLQLTVYMAVVKELLEKDLKGKTIVPEEMYYYTVYDPIIDKDKLSSNKTVEDALKDAMKFAGIKDKEQIEMLIPYVKDKATGLGKRIVGGDIEVAPKKFAKNDTNSCTYCKYRTVCGFDQKIAGFKYKVDKKYDKDEAWEHIRGQVNN